MPNKVEKIEFEPLIEMLSKENLSAEFTPNDDTRFRGRIYGYYHIKQSSMGPIIIEYCDVDDDDYSSDMINIKIRNSCSESYFFSAGKRKNRNVFKKGKNFIKSLPITQSGFSEDEGFLLWYHFLDSPDKREEINKHYLNARVMYDTMHQMMRRTGNTKFFPVNGGYVIETLFDNDCVEVMHIKQIQDYNSNGDPYSVMQIKIPSIGLEDKFDEYKDRTEMMLFQKAEMFIGIANPIPSASVILTLLIQITSPLIFIRGPPLFPVFMLASV